MSRNVKRSLALLGLLALAYAALTAWALESGGVAVVETRADDGSIRATHVWYVEAGGELWLEAGAPENGWVRDVGRDPRLGLRADGRSGAYRAVILASRDDARRVRSLLRDKYGLRDVWVGQFVDGTRSQAVRLVPDPEPGSAGPEALGLDADPARRAPQ